MHLVRPEREHLQSYVAALRRGWAPDNIRGAISGQEELQRINADADRFIAATDDLEAKGPMVKLPDGTEVKRIPGFRRWMWDGEFCGSISLRWNPGTTDLPPHCLGHIGYSVVPWKQRLGMATQALGCLLRDSWPVGLQFVEITTDPHNVASQKVIQANGGVLFEVFTKPPQFDSTPGLRYRIHRADRGG